MNEAEANDFLNELLNTFANQECYVTGTQIWTNNKRRYDELRSKVIAALTATPTRHEHLTLIKYVDEERYVVCFGHVQIPLTQSDVEALAELAGVPQKAVKEERDLTRGGKCAKIEE